MAVSYSLKFVNKRHHNINELHLFIVTFGTCQLESTRRKIQVISSTEYFASLYELKM